MCGTQRGGHGDEDEKKRDRVKTGSQELRGGGKKRGTQEQHIQGHLGDLQEEKRKSWGLGFIMVTMTIIPFYYYCHSHN